MLSKWEWIQKACENEKLYGSAVIARQMEHLLKEKYGNTMTEQWIEDYDYSEPLSLDSIYRIQSSRTYCIGCVHAEFLCENCLLASKDFECPNEKSLYQKFLKLSEWEIKNRIINIEMPC